jgi:hypothetical protein
MSKYKTGIIYILFTFVIAYFFYSIINQLHIHRGIAFGDLTRDPNAIHNAPKYIGLLSQTGMIFWFGTAGILFFTGTIIEHKRISKKILHFLINSFLLTLFLGIDDLFMLHDELAHRGIKEEYFYIFYTIWLIGTIIYFSNIIKQTHYILILAYGLVFAGSIIIDKTIKEAYLMEDMLKFVGIINWAFYWSSSAYLLFQQQKTPIDR